MTKSKVLVAALIVCLLLLAAGAWFSFGGSVGYEYANADKYTVGDATVPGAAEALDVHWIDGEVIVEYHDGDGIRISETSRKNLSEDDRLRWWLDGTTLRIQYAKPALRMFSSLEKSLTVSLPRGTRLKTAAVDAASAAVNVEGLAADEIRLVTTSGSVRGTTDAKKLTAGSTSGSVDLRQEGALESADLGSTSGAAALTAGDVKNLHMSSTSGNLTAILSGTAEQAKLGATSGDIRAEAAGFGRAELGTTSGKVNLRTEAFDEIRIDTTSGEVTAALPENPGFTCEAGTTSGKFSSEISLRQDGTKYTCGNGSGKCSIGTTSGNIRIIKTK